MKRIMTVAIETLFMLTLFAAGWFALVVFQLLTNPIPHGNIGYKMRNKEVVMELGTKIIGDFGGYTELWNGEVITISTYDTGPTTPEVKVKWDNGSGAPLPDVYYESFYKREGRKDWSVGTADYGGRKTDFYYENFSEREGRNDYRVGTRD